MRILLVLMAIGLYAFGDYYGAAAAGSKECRQLKQLPAEVAAFYQKFQDARTALALLKPVSMWRKPACLDTDSYDALLQSYATLQVKLGDPGAIKRLWEKYRDKLFLLKLLGDAYRHNYLSDDRNHLRHRYANRKLALSTYRLYLEKGGKANDEITEFIKTGGLVKAQNRWQERFGITEIPTNRYRVIYFNNKHPKTIIQEDTVPYPAVNYAHDRFPNHKLPSNDFAAYWIGDFEFDTTQEMVLSFEVSWAEFRLIIDGYEVAKSVNDDVHVPFRFTKGTHRIEIEYRNNYGATDFMMSMHPPRRFISNREIRDHITGEYELFYVGKYESDNFNKAEQVLIRGHYTKPIVLILSSYGNIHWSIDSAGHEIKAILVRSYHNGSVVTPLPSVHKNAFEKKVYYLKNFPAKTSLRIKCRCSESSHLYCSGSKVSAFNQTVYNIFGKELDGFTTFYPKERWKNQAILVPQVYLDKQTKQAIEQEEKKMDKLKTQCQRKRTFGIDDIF